MRLFGRRRAEREAERERYWCRRRHLREDVTAYGEQLGALHLDTLTSPLDAEAQGTYRHALESYERAKALLAAAGDTDDLEEVEKALVQGRYQVACVLAAAAGEPAPDRLPECFFNPQHGPSTTRLAWTPPGGTEREVAVCGADAARLEAGKEPDVRMVRVGDRWVPAFAADRAARSMLVDGHAISGSRDRAYGRAVRYGGPPSGGEGGLPGNHAGTGPGG